MSFSYHEISYLFLKQDEELHKLNFIILINVKSILFKILEILKKMSRKSILLVGITGGGKSTTGNCLANRSGENHLMKNIPFKTSDGAKGCTDEYKVIIESDFIIVDTIGFGDPQYNHEAETLNNLRNALKEVNNKIDCVLFVVPKGRFSNEIVKFFEVVQKEVLKNKCKKNSILLITNCDKNWVVPQIDSAESEIFSKELKNAVDKCDGNYFEFKLKIDDQDDNDEDKSRNISRRKKCIDELVRYILSKQFEKQDLTYIQSAEFERTWYAEIVPTLIDILAILAPIPGLEKGSEAAKNWCRNKCSQQ